MIAVRLNAVRSIPLLSIVLSATILSAGLHGAWSQETAPDLPSERALRHQTPGWRMVEAHMPDPKTGTPESLELAADVLRARRMPEDALDFYNYALSRGGNAGRLVNRIGVTQLELQRPHLAQACFRRVIQISRKDAEAWNNLGVTEYMFGNYRGAIDSYKKAIKLEKKKAIFRSNLGTAYFETKDYESARAQFETALRLDPTVFQRGGETGVTAHVLSPQDRGRFCFEMARLAAHLKDEETMLLWLGRASEVGFDLRGEMLGVKEFAGYQKDRRITLLIENARALRAHGEQRQMAQSGPAPALAAEGKKLD